MFEIQKMLKTGHNFAGVAQQNVWNPNFLKLRPQPGSASLDRFGNEGSWEIFYIKRFRLAKKVWFLDVRLFFVLKVELKSSVQKRKL